MERITKGLVSTGFLLIAVAVCFLRLQDGTGYQLSIYSANPVFWVLLAVATVIGLGVAIQANGNAHKLGLCLLVFSGGVMLAFPLIAGYHFYGYSDPMTHLGIVKEIIAGTRDVWSLFYPSLHTFAAVFSVTMNRTAEYSLLLATWALISVWFLLLPLWGRTFTDSKIGMVSLVVGTVLALPSNPVAIYPRPHPITIAVFTLPLILFLFERVNSRRYFTVFIVCSAFLIFLHPLAAFIIIFVAAWYVGVQKVGPFRSDSVNELAKFRGQTAAVLFFGFMTFAWIYRTEQFGNMAAGSILSLLNPTIGAEATSRASSLASTGRNLLLYIIKVGAKYIVWAILATVTLGVGYKMFRWRKQRLALISATVPAGGIILFFFAAGQVGIWTRTLAVIATLGSVLGALGLADLYDWLSGSAHQRYAKLVVFCIAVLGLVVAIPMYHADPYTVRPSQEVTDDSFTSYQTIFEHDSATIEYYEIRGNIYRFYAGINGPVGATSKYSSFAPDAPSHFNNHDLPQATNQSRYLVVDDPTRKREVQIYNGLRYDRTDFHYLDQDRAIYRVYSSNSVTGYFVNATA
jgi:hypothetical protein